MGDDYDLLRHIVAAIGTVIVAGLLRAGYERWGDSGAKKPRKP